MGAYGSRLQAPPTTHRSEMPRKPIIGGNWKCNPAETAKLEGLIANFKPTAATLDKCDIYVCPSNLHLGMVYDKFESGIMVTPQNCNFKGCGAYTGEMAVDQMVDMGLKCCLIGHSERRGEFGLPTPKETNELLATKLAYILEKGLTCVFCIGEVRSHPAQPPAHPQRTGRPVAMGAARLVYACQRGLGVPARVARATCSP